MALTCQIIFIVGKYDRLKNELECVKIYNRTKFYKGNGIIKVKEEEKGIMFQLG